MGLSRRLLAPIVALVLSAGGLACGGQEQPPAGGDRRPAPAAEPRPEAEQRSGGASEEQGENGGRSGDQGRSPAGGGDGYDAGGGKDGGSSERPYDPDRPDAPGNDVPPPPGSAAERFERFCEKNPSECF